MIDLNSLTDAELADLSRERPEDKEVAEEIRFRAEIKNSTPAVQAVAEYYLRTKGGEIKTLADADFVDRKAFKDAGADIAWRLSAQDQFMLVEVKRRDFSFSSRETWPFKTVFVDRATKPTMCDIYFIVSRDLNYAAVVPLTSQSLWGRTTIFDNKKGYPVTAWECPTEHAEFIDLKSPAVSVGKTRRPLIPPTPPVTPWYKRAAEPVTPPPPKVKLQLRGVRVLPETRCPVCYQTGGKFERVTYTDAPLGGLPVHTDCIMDFFAYMIDRKGELT